MDYQIKITNQSLSIDEAFAFINHPNLGGNCIFVGTVRRKTEDQMTESLEFESFETMAKKEMEKIAQGLLMEFGPGKCYMSHLIGNAVPGQIVVIIALATAHRKNAFLGCEQGIDTLKKVVPIWKKEILEDGSYWVNAHP